MPWLAAAIPAVASAATSISNSSKGAQGPRNIDFENVNADPWSVQSYGQAQGALSQQQLINQQLAAQNGIQNQSSVFQQQQGLANQLQQNANGQGPNPAQALLANQTGANAQQQAALMGSQRGSSANVGLMARQAGQQGAAIQQQGVGQAAALQAQQRLAAQQALMQQQAQMSGLATNQVGQLQNSQNAYQTGAQNLFATQSQNIGNWNSANVSAATNATTAASQFGIAQMQGQEKESGGALNGAGGALSLLGSGKYNGGSIGYSQGGPVSQFGRACNMKSGGRVPGQAQVAGNSPKNDTVPAMLSPGEAVIDRETMARKDAVGKAARMVTAYINKKNKK